MALSRGARFIVTFMLTAVVVSMTAVLLTLFFAGRGPTVESNSILWLRISSGLEEYQRDELWSLIGSGDTVGSVVDALRKAKVDDRVSAVVVMPGQQVLWGKVQEIRDAITDFKSSGKPIVAYLEYGGGQPYYLATACDEIYLTPSSSLDLVGVASYELFLRDALDKAGVVPDMLHAGDYKTASNLYTENTFTPEHREMSESLNRDLYDTLVEGIAEGRGLSSAEVRATIDAGPLLPDEAVERGMIDALIYEDELMERLPVPNPRRLRYADYRRVRARSLGLDRGPRIAVVYGIGAITLGRGGTDVTGGGVMGSDTMVQALRSARDDRTVEAIVLRVDSPGGSAVASDIIWRDVALAREEKPVIVSMSDVAASGGYYIAMPATAIVAQPSTLTGSIGVVGGKLVPSGTLEKLGINVEAVTNGKNADLFSPVAPFSEDGRERFQIQIDDIYERFLAKVAEGRSMTRDEVHAIAQGRVWTGRQAKDLGLVDELGGLRTALALAKEEAGIDPDREVTIVAYPRPRTFFEQLSDSPFLGMADRSVRWLVSPYVRAVASALGPLQLFRSGEPLTLMPFVWVR